ncbi:MAG: glycosyltransferase family 4 protein [Xanthobacteraceae bacterium]
MQEEARLRVGIDLAPLRPPWTGVGNYQLQLLQALVARDDAPALEGLRSLRPVRIDKPFIDSMADAKADARAGTSATGRLPAWIEPAAARIYLLLRSQTFAWRARSSSWSLFHSFLYVPPGPLKVPVIPVVYDVSFVRFPEMHPARRLRALAGLGRLLENAPVVHTISQFSAAEIAAVYGISLRRIKVIYPGVGTMFMGATPTNGPGLMKYDLAAGRYFLVVSTLEPRKNLRTLVAAYSRLPQTERAQVPLCVVGPSGWGLLELPMTHRELEREGSLRFLGFVADADLPMLYANARAMLYPSIYEGFGLPILEALACGCPVICSNAASMPEAAGEAAQRISPLDVDAWTGKFKEAMAAKSSEREKADRIAHARRFTWERAAAQTIDLYKEALAR